MIEKLTEKRLLAGIILQKKAENKSRRLNAAAFQNTVFCPLGCGQRSDGDSSKKNDC